MILNASFCSGQAVCQSAPAAGVTFCAQAKVLIAETGGCTLPFAGLGGAVACAGSAAGA